MILKNLAKSFKFIWDFGKGWLIFSALLSIILGLIPIITIWTTKELVNNVANLIMANEVTKMSYTVTFSLLIFQFLLLLIDSLIKHIQQYLDEKVRLTIHEVLTKKISYHSIQVSYSNFDDPSFYNHLNRIKSNAGSHFLSPINSILVIFQSLITISSLFFFLLSIHWSLALISTIGVLPTLLIKSYFGNKSFQLNKKLIPILRETNYIENLLLNKETAKEVRVFNLGEYLLNRWQQKYSENCKHTLSFIKIKSKVEIFLDAITALSYCAAAGIIIWLIKKSSVKIGDFVSIGQAVHSTQSALNMISTNVAKLYEDQLYLVDYFSFLEKDDEQSDHKERKYLFPNNLKKGIVFENVSFSYNNNSKKILDDISFTVNVGEKIAIVGHNGSGKTTLIKCLLGLYPITKGNIFFDDISINKIKVKSLKEHITVIFQDFAQYYFTVKENISFGNIKKVNDDNLVREVAMKTQIDSMIQNLPNTYGTYLGRFLREGTELSGGQWQKIAISRALFKGSNIMILDEPTAALDPLAEQEIFEQFKSLTVDKTSFFISHRMSAAKLADKIVVLDEGKLVEFGTHEELMAKEGVYAKMFITQAELYEVQVKEVMV
ncbi:ABC transporter ATP-binding protein [Bacillus wiedmannii]|uniref:ABC transporter ATP-binding protein n=1 Tax=Bacillus wiedmannii TaxID=1890302 RepID=UPI000BF201CE|nr:ABC transporter ATP-binding protein [Bacillus wiedmannii]PEM50116.1 hypothetical protein CN618_16150 [Bacillus wiedmannii]